MRLRPCFPWLLGALCAAGCTVGPAYRPEPAAAPQSFLNAAPQAVAAPAPAALPAPATEPAAAAARWWSDFHDPLLEELIGQALDQNLDLAAAQARLRQARAQVRVAGGNRYPALSADASAVRSRTSENGQIPLQEIPGVKITATDFLGGFDASWEIDLFGYERRTVEASAAQVDVAAAAARGVVISTAAEVAADYFDLRGAQARLAVLDASLADARQALDLMRQRRRAGDVADADVAQADGRLQSLQAGRPALVLAAGTSEYQLELLLGLAPGALAGKLAAPAPLPAAAPPPFDLPSRMLQRRPDVLQAQAQLHAATAQLGAAVADEFPRFALVGGFGDQSIRSGDFLAAASRYWSLGPQLTLPLLRGGALAAQVDTQKAALAAAQASYRKAVLAALADAEGAFLGDGQAREQLRSLQQRSAALNRVLTTQQQRYAAGDIPLSDLLEARQQWNDARDGEIAAQAQACRQRVALFKALGGGWSGP